MYKNLKFLHMTDFSPHIPNVIYVTNIRYGPWLFSWILAKQSIFNALQLWNFPRWQSESNNTSNTMQHHAIPCNAINTKSMQYFWLSLNNIKYQRWGQHWPGMRYYSDKIDIHLNLPQKPWLCNRQPKIASTLYESRNLMTLNGLIHKKNRTKIIVAVHWKWTECSVWERR